MRLLTSRDLMNRFTMTDVVGMVETAYREKGRGEVVEAPRVQLRSAQSHTFFNTLPALIPGLAAVGVSTYTGGNKGRPLPQKVTLLFSADDGRLLAVVESDWLSWMRTGATSGVATRYLAREDATVAGIIGAGKQARSQLMAVAAVRPLTRALVYSRSPDHGHEYAAQMSGSLDIPVERAPSVEALLNAADIICTATTAREPLFDGRRVRPGSHINAIGQHYPDRREVDTALVARSRVIVDDAARALAEDGELLIPQGEGAWDPASLAASLGEVVAGVKRGRRNPEEITLFSSGGIASEVVAVTAGLYQVAAREDLGTEIDWTVDVDYWRTAVAGMAKAA